MDIKTTKILLELVKASIWGNDSKVEGTTINEDVYEELEKQAIAVLPIPIIPKLSIPSEINATWKKAIFKHLTFNCNYRYIQSILPLQVPYVILKGIAAAQYYPYPEYRAMGDIDIITKREDYLEACSMMLKDGFQEIEGNHEDERGRHRSFVKNGITIEIHRFFSLLNNAEQAKYLDDLIIQSITPTHLLPDKVNGLVILEHISQHLENGLGLRQIIDWMMFVEKCIPDENWFEYAKLTERIGLKTLAIVTTRMCEIYLGLTEHNWCKEADIGLCKQLMDYVLCSGNFGNKRTSDSDIVKNVLVIARNPKAAFQLFQTRGLLNWKAAQKYYVLRPFAWLFQIWRYFFRGINRNKASSKLKLEFKTAQERNKMLEKLGVRQASKGQTYYKNGEYVKQ